jgi:copper chaperone
MTQELTVRDMSCAHCVSAITNELKAVPGVRAVSIDLASKRVRVNTGDDVATETLIDAINEAGYVDISVPR